MNYLVLILLFIAFISCEPEWGVNAYNNPDIFMSMANGLFLGIRSTLSGELFSYPLYPSLSQFADELLVVSDSAINISLENQQSMIGYGISVLIPWAPILLFWLLTVLAVIPWLIAQCCQCCCCKGVKPICRCCFWDDLGPKTGCVWCTRITFVISAVCSIFFTVLISVTSFQLPSAVAASASIFPEIETAFDSVKGIGPIVENVTTTAFSFVDTAFSNITTVIDLDSVLDILDSVDTLLNETGDKLDDVQTVFSNISYLFLDGLADLVATIKDVQFPIDVDMGAETAEAAGSISYGSSDSTTFRTAMAELHDILTHQSENLGISEDLNTTISSLLTYVNNGLSTVSDDLNEVATQVQTFLTDIVDTASYDVLGMISAAQTAISDIGDQLIEQTDVDTMVTAIDNAVTGLADAISYLEFLRNKVGCWQYDPDTGMYDAGMDSTEQDNYCHAIWVFVDEASTSAQNSLSRLSRRREINGPTLVLTTLFDEKQTFDSSATPGEYIIDDMTDLTEAALSSFDDSVFDDFSTQLDTARQTIGIDSLRGMIQNIQEMINYYGQIIDGTKQQVDGTLTPTLTMFSSMDNPVTPYESVANQILSQYSIYMDLVSYVMAGLLIFLVIVLLLAIIVSFACPKCCCCLCCTQCTLFAYMSIFGLIFVVFSLVGVVLEEATHFIYSGDMLTFAKSSGLLSFASSMITKNKIPEMAYSIGNITLNTTELIPFNKQFVEDIITYYLTYTGEEENLLGAILANLNATIMDFADMVVNINDFGILPAGIVVQPPLLSLLDEGIGNVTGRTDKLFSSLTTLTSGDFLSKLVFHVSDTTFLSFSKLFMSFWLSSLFLFFFFFFLVICLGWGRTYWTFKRMTLKEYELSLRTAGRTSQDQGTASERSRSNRQARNRRRRSPKTQEEREREMEEMGYSDEVEDGYYGSDDGSRGFNDDDRDFNYDEHEYASDLRRFGPSGIVIIAPKSPRQPDQSTYSPTSASSFRRGSAAVSSYPQSDYPPISPSLRLSNSISRMPQSAVPHALPYNSTVRSPPSPQFVSEY